MTRNIVCLGLMALAMLADGRAAEPYGVIYETNVPMKTRDGVTLRADIYRPKADGKFPVLLERTPYDKYSNVDSGILVGEAELSRELVDADLPSQVLDSPFSLRS